MTEWCMKIEVNRRVCALNWKHITNRTRELKWRLDWWSSSTWSCPYQKLNAFKTDCVSTNKIHNCNIYRLNSEKKNFFWRDEKWSENRNEFMIYLYLWSHKATKVFLLNSIEYYESIKERNQKDELRKRNQSIYKIHTR